MNWNSAITTLFNSDKTTNFTIGGKKIEGNNEKDLQSLVLYFTHSISILLSRKMLFNCLVVKENDNKWGYIGDGEILGDKATAILCLLESIEIVASLESSQHKLGQTIDITETLSEWRQILANVPIGKPIDCKEFTKHLMKELINNLSNKTLITNPMSSL